MANYWHHWRNLEISNKINLIGLVLVFVFSSVNLFRSCNQAETLEDLRYQINAINYQPKIKIVGEPKIIDYKMDSTSIKVSVKDLIQGHLTGKVPTFKAKTKEKFTFDLRLVNIGNSMGRILGIVTTDTISANEVLRKRILSGNLGLGPYEPFPPYLQNELLPNSSDTVVFKLEEPIQVIGEESGKQFFTLHFLILYENELGHLYDTYVWTKFTYSDLLLPSPFAIKDNLLLFNTEGKRVIKMAKKDIAKLVALKVSFKTYDYKNSKHVRNIIETSIKDSTRK